MQTLIFAPETINIAETTRMIEIAKAVRKTFRCIFCGYSSIYSHLIEQAGFEFRRLQPWLTAEKVEHLWRVDRMESFADPFTEAELRQRVANEIALFSELRPAAVVIGFTLSAVVSTRAAKVPLVYVMPFPLTRPFLDAGLATWPDALDFAPLRIIPQRLLNWATNQWLKRSTLWIKSFDRVARHYGVAPIRRLTDIYEGDFNLVTDIPQLAGIRQLPPNWHFIGPIFAHLPGEVPPELLRLPRDRPLIYCAMGSSANRSILKTVIESFAGTPYMVIAPIKAHLAEGTITVPANVLVYDWLPAPQVNPLTDLAVIHGGQGTVQTACASGTPFVGIGLQPEQESNIDTVVRFGSAVRIRKRRLTQRSLLAAIERLLHDSHARDKARELQQLTRAWDGTAQAATFLRQTFGADSPTQETESDGRDACASEEQQARPGQALCHKNHSDYRRDRWPGRGPGSGRTQPAALACGLRPSVSRINMRRSCANCSKIPAFIQRWVR